MLRFFLCLALFAGGPLLAKDYALIQKLPPRVTAAKKKVQEDWDSGVTSRMRDASNKYNEALAGIIRDLGKAYYPEDTVTAKAVEEYIESLVKEFSFKQIASNPSGESLGTIASLDIASGVTSSLEGTIEEMVESIVGEDESFNVEKWKTAWDKAVAEE